MDNNLHLYKRMRIFKVQDNLNQKVKLDLLEYFMIIFGIMNGNILMKMKKVIILKN